MTHIKYIIIVFLFFPALSISQEYLSLSSPRTGYITDMVLLYQGGKSDIKYSPSEIQPYVFRYDSNAKFQWLYDSFLFLSGRHPNGKVYDGTWGSNAATKDEWSWVVDELFKKNQGLNALESVIDSLVLSGNIPVRKRKIVISIPQPVQDQIDWGKVKGKSLNFSSNNDRLNAVKWFVNEVMRSWNESNFKHLELTGFYFFKENSRGDEEIIHQIGQYVKSKNLIYYWIPYLWAPGYDKAYELGFDVAYQQPNYFFKKSNFAPDGRMELVLKHAKTHNMGLEMEFNSDIQYVFYQMRFLDYLNWFEKYGVWDQSTVAYYQSSRTFIDMSESNDPLIQILYDKLCNIINARQLKADTIYLNDRR